MCFWDIVICVFLIETRNFFTIASGSCRSDTIRENTFEVGKLACVLGTQEDKNKEYCSQSLHLKRGLVFCLDEAAIKRMHASICSRISIFVWQIMLIYTTSITSRLQYISDFIGKELTGTAFQLTDSKDKYLSHTGSRINYSAENFDPGGFWLKPVSLLAETGIKEQATGIFIVKGHQAFFKTEGDLSYDIFAATFYLLSRYEEYLPSRHDVYGRYAHTNSLAFRNNFLDIPLVNTWLNSFREILAHKFPDVISRDPVFQFIPTYDIDEAYSFKHKSAARMAGAFIKSLVKGNWAVIKDRREVLSGKRNDPFDSYDWMNELHREFELSPRYFFHVAARTGKYDRNISPGRPALRNLIRAHAERYQIGLHPSWQSGDDPRLIQTEKETLERIAGKQIISSRQHFIRFNLPETFRSLLSAGILEDFSMGYGSINGFRASVATPFYWYDLEKEKATGLLLYPFCYMEANSFYEQRISAQQALEEMRHYYDVVRKVNGTLITIWHNTFLGTAAFFNGWREAYEQFISEVNA
jgi:hypothetical protein